MKEREQIVRDYYRRIQMVKIEIGLVIVMVTIFFGSYLIDKGNPALKAFVRNNICSEPCSIGLFIFLLISGISIGIYAFRCPVCDSYMSGKRENSNYCPTCKRNFDINDYR